MGLKQFRCKNCHKVLFLFRGKIVDIEIKCPKCKKVQELIGEKA